MLIIPAIDLIDGKCVRLTQGDYSQKKEYNSNPLEVAKAFENAGLTHLHLVDLDGAKQKRIVNVSVLERIASYTNLHIDFGGGIQSDLDIGLAFDAGADQVTAGSIAIKNPELVCQWIEHYGPEKIILGADVRDGEIAISGWQESSGMNLNEFLDFWLRQGIRYTVSTDVAKDGLLQGPSVALYQQMRSQYPDLQIIASGGVSSLADLEALRSVGVYGAIVGKAFYEGRVSVEELAGF